MAQEHVKDEGMNIDKITYTRGVDTPYPNRFSKKAWVTNIGIVLPQKVIKYMSLKKYFYVFTVILMIWAIAGIFIKGLNLSLDFTGGRVIEVQFSKVVRGSTISETLAKAGFEGAEATASGSGKEVIIRLPAKIDQEGIDLKISNILKNQIDPESKVANSEYVGPKAGTDLVNASVMSFIFTVVMLLCYVSFRFQWRLSLGAVAALIHDTLVTIGIFAWFQIDVDMNFVAAILSVLGYSINDTIVVFDRMRENIRKLHTADVEACINISLTETLNRTILTSLTTFIVVLILLFFGGPSLHIFSLALAIGILFGTYSSIYIAAAFAFDLGLKKEDMLIRQVNKDGLEEYEF